MNEYEEYEGPEGTTRIPLTANEWDLYSDMKGANLAARRLTAAMKKAIDAPKRKIAIEIMSKALEADSKYGAADTEPRGIAERCLSQARGGDYSWTL